MQKLRPEIILIGDDSGTKEICEELDLIHEPYVRRNEYNTPLVDSVFQNAEAIASNNFLCYVNSDIILLSDFFKALNEVEKRMSERGKRDSASFDVIEIGLKKPHYQK